jgi:hypothetical protein
MSTIKQQWAQKRNFAKSRLMGMEMQLNILCGESYITPMEKKTLRQARIKIELALRDWNVKNAASKMFFLKAQERISK